MGISPITPYFDQDTFQQAMLRSLDIRNYRNLRHLTIEKLGRVNLLVGKNNTGKTSVLEAVGILVKRGEMRLIYLTIETKITSQAFVTILEKTMMPYVLYRPCLVIGQLSLMVMHLLL